MTRPGLASSGMDLRRWFRAASVALLVVGCSSVAGDGTPPAPAPAAPAATSGPLYATGAVTTTVPRAHSPLTTEYRPGLSAHLFLPASPGGPAPVVVMVPGGAWRTADPAGYEPLARFLAGEGATVVTVEVGSAQDGSLYPAPVEDVLCAVAYAVDAAGAAGVEMETTVVVGHSSGAHLAALAALREDGSSPGCDHPPARIDGLVGLAGVYDVARLPALAYLLFGVPPEDDPDLWSEGNPLLRAGGRDDLPVLLLHGHADELVPVSFTTDFATALDGGGHDTEVTIVADADHHDIITPGFVGDPIRDWIEGLAALRAPGSRTSRPAGR